MATIVFAPFIQHFVKCPPMEAPGNSVSEVLDNYFQEFPKVRDYILNEQGCLRPRLVVFVDGTILGDRVGLSDPVHLRARVFVAPMLLDNEYESL
jgi:hypothetical protein